MLLILTTLAAALVMLFQAGAYTPIWLSLAVMAGVTAHVIHQYREERFGPLNLVLYLVYMLPFIHVVPYLWFDFDAPSPDKMWGIAVNPYMIDERTVELMSMMGAVGALALAIGTGLVRGRLSRSTWIVTSHEPSRQTLSMPVFVGWIAIAVVLSWVSAPAELLFSAEYGASTALDQKINFSSAWMLSYAFLVYGLADSMFERKLELGKQKRRLVLYASLVIVVWFQLLRGDRESLPLVLSAILIYYVWGKGLIDPARLRVRLSRTKLALLGVAVFSAAYLVGHLRHSLTRVEDASDVMTALNDTGVDSLDNALSGTWSAVLLTPLSVAGDHVRRPAAPRYGQTYVDMIGSTMPGFVADWIGYRRPIDATRGPAWEMRYGQGGTHAVVVPFLNFGMVGVFVIIVLWSYATARIERYALRRVSVVRLSLLGVIAMAAPHWLWYGEKNLITAAVIWAGLAVLHRISKVDGVALRSPRGVADAA